MKALFTLLFVLLLFSSCVSSKKYKTLAADNDRTIKLLQDKLDARRTMINEMKLDLAERKGENNILTANQTKQQRLIDSLENTIERINTQAANQQRSMDEALEAKSAEIAQREQTLESLKVVMDKRQQDLNSISRDIRNALPDMVDESVMIQPANGKLSIALAQDILFRKGATGKIERTGAEALQKIAEILITYPAMNVMVIGHTDNSAPPRNSITDNWTYSVLRAATVVQVITEEYDLSPNRVIAAGMGEFAPRASNASGAGRALNHRVELLVSPSDDNLLLDIRRKLD